MAGFDAAVDRLSPAPSARSRSSAPGDSSCPHVAEIDPRLDAVSRADVVETNPNPDLTPNADFA